MRTNVLKSFIFLLVSACFLISGIFIMSAKKESVVFAETSIVDDIENNVPDYVGIEGTGDAVSTTLVSDDIFLYDGSNSLSVYLKTNGGEVNSGGGEIYDYVYYPDQNNLSMFYFYRINGINLSINGVEQSLQDKIFTTPSNLTFENLTDVIPEKFEMNFASTSNDNTISLLNESGNLVEGLYTIEVEIDLWQCTAGRSDQSEESSSFNNTADARLVYSFLVLNESSYIVNNRPVYTQNNFDSSATIPTSVNQYYGTYLYSNYSYEGNQIASLTYDQTRYDVTIVKELNSTYQTATLSYIAEDDNGETSGYTLTGDDIIRYQKNGDLTTIYFYNIGNYSVSFDAVATTTLLSVGGEAQFNKYNLTPLAELTKDVMVYVYGYQATHIDYDNNREFVEFKT